MVLKLRFSRGTSGYNSPIDCGIPLLSIRTLQSRLRSIYFQPGVLTFVFSYLKDKVSAMEDERDCLCCLTLDEMEITSRTEYDAGSRTVLGDCTLGGSGVVKLLISAYV